MQITRNDVVFTRTTKEGFASMKDAVELSLVASYLPKNLGTRVKIIILPAARKDFPVDKLWTDHGEFLEDEALRALNELI